MCAAKQHRHQGRLILSIDVFLDFIVFLAVGGDLGRVIGWLAIVISIFIIIIIIVMVVPALLCFISCNFSLYLSICLNLIGYFLPDCL